MLIFSQCYELQYFKPVTKHFAPNVVTRIAGEIIRCNRTCDSQDQSGSRICFFWKQYTAVTLEEVVGHVLDVWSTSICKRCYSILFTFSYLFVLFSLALNPDWLFCQPVSIVSYNHLGNNDGKNLSAPQQFRSKEVSNNYSLLYCISYNRNWAISAVTNSDVSHEYLSSLWRILASVALVNFEM